MNCFDECWNLTDKIGHKLGCKLLNGKFEDDMHPEYCEHFKFIESCPNCMYHRTRLYESGTLDGVGYLCTLQDNKEIFQDVRPLAFNYSDVPKCPIGRFKRE